MTEPTRQPGYTGRPTFADIPPRVGERGFNIAFRRLNRSHDGHLGHFTVEAVDDETITVQYERDGGRLHYRRALDFTMLCLEHDTRFNIGDRIRWGAPGSTDHTEVTITGIARNPPLDDKNAVGLTADRLRYVTDNPEFGEPFTVDFVDSNWTLVDPRDTPTTTNPTEEPVTDTITATAVSVDQYRRERDEARQELARMRSDVAILNELLNDAAADRGLCAEYEEALNAFNNETGNRLGLVGRRRTRRVSFDVRVKFTGSDDEFDNVCAAFAEHLYMKCDGDYGDNDVRVEVSSRPDYTDLDD